MKSSNSGCADASMKCLNRFNDDAKYQKEKQAGSKANTKTIKL
jgi:hypothetical protein